MESLIIILILCTMFVNADGTVTCSCDGGVPAVMIQAKATGQPAGEPELADLPEN